MKRFALIISSIIFILISSCGKDFSPEEIGKSIGETYGFALSELSKLVKEKPEAKMVKDKVINLKEKVIQKLVKLGKMRETLSDSDKSKVDLSAREVMMKIGERDDWKVMSQAQQYYFSIDNELSNIIADFNIITQYAFFELLRKQKPKEAKKLGIQ